MFAIITGVDGDCPPAYDPDSAEMLRTLYETKDCCFCLQPLPLPGVELVDPTDMRVMDHDHFTGSFRGIAHSRCNIRAHKPNQPIDCFFHNLSGYDVFHLLQSIGDLQDGWSERLEAEPTAQDPTGVRDAKIKVLAKSSERFTTLSWGKRVTFKDTFQFMPASLDTLVRNLGNSFAVGSPERAQAFQLLTRWHRYRADTSSEDFERLIKKGVYPYTFAKSMKDLYETTEIPTREQYATDLRGEISEGEYRRARWFWDYTKCANMMDNTLAYNELDVLLLASVAEAFRAVSIESYGLDMVHFVTMPSFSFHAMMLFNMRRGVEVETFAETDDGSGMVMFGMAEAGIRGGMCQVMHPIARAHPMDEGEIRGQVATPDQPLTEEQELDRIQAQLAGTDLVGEAPLSGESRVLYYDAVNLYGCAMSEPMPLGDYRLIKKSSNHVLSPQEYERRMADLHLARANAAPEGSSMGLTPAYITMMEHDMAWFNPDMGELNDFIRDTLDAEDPVGYLVDVDVTLPPEFHDLLNDMPPFPENKLPPGPSPFTEREFARQTDLRTAFKHKKLILDLTDKKGYVVHYRLLQFFCRHMHAVVTKVNRVVSFQQSRWLRDYIDFNNQKRKQARNDVEKDQFKLANNAIFGKMMENVRGHRDIQFYLSSQWTKAVKDSSSPRFKQARVIVPDKLLLVEKAQPSVRANRPIIVGQAILDVSKVRAPRTRRRCWPGGRPRFTLRTTTDPYL